MSFASHENNAEPARAPERRSRASVSAVPSAEMPARSDPALPDYLRAPSPAPGLEWPPALRETVAKERGRPLRDAPRWSSMLGVDVSAAETVESPLAQLAAASIAARAFTVGPRIFFGAGAGSSDESLLGHELAHVAQQRNAAPRGALALASPAAEREADTRAVTTGWPLAVARDAVVDDPQQIELPKPDDSGEYYESDRLLFLSELLTRLPKHRFTSPSPYVTVTDSFGYWLANSQLQEVPWSKMWALVQPYDLDTAIRRLRMGLQTSPDPHFHGNYEEVGELLAQALEPRIQESINRILPQYLAATYLAAKKAQKPYEDFLYTPTQPIDANLLVPSAPLDKLVIGYLTEKYGLGVQLSLDQYAKDGHGRDAEKALIRLHDVKFEWLAASGNPLWIRVAGTPTREEVAQTLYGDSSLAPALVAAAPMYGFYPDLLAASQKPAWKQALGAAPEPKTVLNPYAPRSRDASRWSTVSFDDPSMDPAFGILQGAARDEVAIAQARMYPPTGKPKADVVKRMRDSIRLLDGMRAEVEQTGGPASMLGPLRATLDERSKLLSASTNDVDALKWDAQSQEQFRLLGKVANGIHHAAELYRSFAGDNAATSLAMKDLAPFVQRALIKVVAAYVLPAVQADLVATAGESLARAEHQSQEFPVDLLEGVLNWIRWVLGTPKVGLDAIKDQDFHDPYDTKTVKEQETHFREELAKARGLIDTDPDAAQKIIDSVQEEVFDLQGEVVLIEGMSECASEMNFMWGNITYLGTINWGIFWGSKSKNDEYLDDAKYLSDFFQNFYYGYLLFKSALGHPDMRDVAREYMRGLQPSMPELQKHIESFSSEIESREKHEAWIKLGFKIAALIAIAIASAGVGSYISGSLLVGAGWGTTAAGTAGAFAISSGAEALVFTTLSGAILGQDPQHGFLESFLTNWALFGALKGLSLAYEGAIGAKAAATFAGKSGNVALGLAAGIGTTLMMQDRDQRNATGNGMTREQATETVVTGLAVAIGTALVARYGGGQRFLEGAYLAGAESPLAEQFRIVDAERATVYIEALKLSKSTGKTDPEAIKNTLAKDTGALEAERKMLDRIYEEIAKNPDIVARMGLKVEAILSADRLNAAQLDASIRMQIQLELEGMEGDLLRCNPGRLDDIVAKLRKLGDDVIVIVDPVTRERMAVVKPKTADPMRIVEPRPEEETIPTAVDPVELELAQIRQTLSADAQRGFDDMVGKAKNKEKVLATIKGFGDRMEEILAKKGAAKVPVVKTPFGAALDEARAIPTEADNVQRRFADSNIPGFEDWIRRLNDQRTNLEKMLSGEAEATPEQVAEVKKQIAALTAELDSALEHNAEQVNVKQTYIDRTGTKNNVDIDHKAEGGKHWNEVKDWSTFGTGSDRWPKVKEQNEDLISAAKQAKAKGDPVEQITWDFRRGVAADVKAALEQMSEPGIKIVVEGPVRGEPSGGTPTDSGPTGGGTGPRLFEPFVGGSLDSPLELMSRVPGSQVTAAEARFIPPQPEITAFQAAGGQFLPERFGESLPDNSIDQVHVRFPIPEAKGMENLSFEFAQQLARDPQLDPHALAERLQSEIESVGNLGPQALRQLTPGGTVEIIFWESQIIGEVEKLTGLRWTDPTTGKTYQFEVKSAASEVQRSEVAPHSGFGIPPEVEVVNRMTVAKVEVAPAAPAPPARTGGQMLGDAIQELKAAPAAQRQALFEQRAAEITAATKGQWSAKSIAASDGATIFVGEGGEALVIDAQGGMWRGRLGDPSQFVIQGDINKPFAPQYDKLRPIEPATPAPGGMALGDLLPGLPFPENPLPQVVQRASNWCGAACGEMAARRLGADLFQEQLVGTEFFTPEFVIDDQVVEAGGFQNAELAQALTEVAPIADRTWVGGELSHPMDTPAAVRETLTGFLESTKASIILRVHGTNHFIVVDGIGSDGLIIIRDPAHSQSRVLSPDELLTYYRPSGGVVMSFSAKK